jgi:hypothetical protein
MSGLYGKAAVLREVLDPALGLIAGSRDSALLALAVVQAVLACPPVEVGTHRESGALRCLDDGPEVSLGAGGPRARLSVASHPATSTSVYIGKKRDGMGEALFATRLAGRALSAKAVLDRDLHRGSFESVVADEDSEQEPDRCWSHARFLPGVLPAHRPRGLESAPGTRTTAVSRPEVYTRICSGF